MGPVAAVATGWRKGLSFRGRASRAEYWWWALFYILVLGAAGGTAIVLSDGDSQSSAVALITFFVLLAALTIPYYAVAARRLHDIGHTGWWLLLPLFLQFLAEFFSAPGSEDATALGKQITTAASLSYLALLVFLAMPSQAGENKYGAEPRARETGKGHREANSKSDAAWYAQVGRELKDGDYEPAAWARAMEQGGSDELKVKSLYTRLRLAALRGGAGEP